MSTFAILDLSKYLQKAKYFLYKIGKEYLFFSNNKKDFFICSLNCVYF